MGKQSKRKRQKGRQHTPSLSTDTGSADSAESSGGNALLSKIRHGDPRVRHAALVALSSTVYSGSKTAAVAKASDPLLLRALSERLLDEDVPCAVIAAGCLSNHVSFSSELADANNNKGTNGASKTSDKESELEVASQVMIPILLQRIQLSLDLCIDLGRKIVEIKSTTVIVSTSSANTNASGANKKSPSDKLDKLRATTTEQWTLQSLSLQTLSGLIENCPLAISRLESAFPILLKVLQCAARCVSGQIVEKEAVIEAANNAGRALHSLLDENVELISAIPGVVPSIAEGPTVISAVNELNDIITNGMLSDTARLHACGAVLSLRKVLLMDREENAMNAEEAQISQALQSCTCTVIIPTLHSLLSLDTNGNKLESPKALVERMMTTFQLLSSQRQDEEMESAIVSEINARKEPARLIARRQKEMKQKKEADEAKEKEVKRSADEMDMEEKADGVMVVEDDASNNNDSTSDADANPSDPKEELETILHVWREICTSHKLALELVANLCSGPANQDEEEEDDDMMHYDEENEHMWDSDDEAKLMAETGGEHKNDTSPMDGEMDGEVFSSISRNHLVEMILLFFKCWTMFVPSISGEGTECPALVVDDVQELLSTGALCLGNMIACELPTWSSPVSKEVGMVLCPAADPKNGAELFWCSLISLLNAAELITDKTGLGAISHVTSVMLSLLRHHAITRTFADAPTLDKLISLLSSEGSDSNTDDSLTRMHCNIIAIMGVLCSEPHAASVNSRVCAALTEKMRTASNPTNSIEATKNSIIVLNEVYNVIIDMYGGDDANNEVYAQHDVSGHFTRTLPGFKRCVKRVASLERENGEVGVWNETALNVNRFIRFKRDG